MKSNEKVVLDEDGRKSVEASLDKEIQLSRQEFNLLVEVFSTLRQWSLDLKRSERNDSQVDDSRTQS